MHVWIIFLWSNVPKENGNTTLWGCNVMMHDSARKQKKGEEPLKRDPWKAETLWGVSTEQPVDTGYKLWKGLQDTIANSAGEDQIKIALSGEIMSNWHCWGWYPDKPATSLGNNLGWLPDLLGRFVKHCWGCQGSALLGISGISSKRLQKPDTSNDWSISNSTGEEKK